MKRSPKLVIESLLPFGFFALIGSLCLVAAVVFAIGSLNKLSTSVRTQGSVVDFRAARNSDGDVLYAPVVEFTAQNGQRYEFTGNVRSRPAEYALEQKVMVLYDPTNPQGAIVESFMEMWFASALLGFIGGVFAAIGWTGVYFMLRSRHKQ